MGNFITTMSLKAYAASLLNRGQEGFGKQVIFGGVNRARVSSQCLKKAVRREAGFTQSYRSSHLEDLVEGILNEMTETGRIKSEDVQAFGEVICKALNCDWGKREAVKKDGKKEDEDKGRTVVVANPVEIIAIINAVTSCENDKDREKAAEQALRDVCISVDKAMFGTMATDGKLGNVDGAVQVGQTFSIDEYMPENDYITAVFSEADVEETDPFYKAYKDFSEKQQLKSGAETIADSWMNANVMFTPSCVNVSYLKKNLSTGITQNTLDISEEAVLAKAKDCISDYMEKMAITDPSAKQNSMSTHPAPAIYYIECIKGGNCQYADFEKVIRRKSDKGIAEQGVEKILEFAKDETFRTGEIHRYVMLSAPYKVYEKVFSEAGIKVLGSMKELRDAMSQETERLFV